MLSRRKFMLASSAVATILSCPGNSLAWIHGNAGATGRSVINGLGPNAFPFLNLLKGASLGTAGTLNYPTILNNDGYLTTAPGTSVSNNFACDPTYFGHYIQKWTGQGSFQMGPATIVYSGGSFVTGVTPSASGSVAFNFAIVGKSNPRVEFAFGFLITAVADNGSGLVRLTSTLSNAFTNISTGSQIQINNVPGLGSTTWTITKIDANHCDLQGSTYSGTMIPAANAEAILSVSQVSWNLLSTGPYVSMAGHVVCKLADEAAVDSGLILSQNLVDQVRALNPRLARWLDVYAAINSTATNFTYRTPVTAWSYAATRWVTDYQVGAISRGASDAYTCANPTASGVGAYVDGEVVQGQIDLASLTTTPTLNVNSRGAADILDLGCTPQTFILSGTVGIGDVFHVTFTGSYIAGSPYTLTYTAVSTDINVLRAGLIAAVNTDATLIAANIFGTNTAGICGFVYNRNAGSGTTFSATTTGATTLVIGRVIPGFLAANALRTFTYNKVLNAWIIAGTSSPGALNSGWPIEAIIELCNRASVGLWLTIPLFYSLASVASLVAYVRDNLNPSLPFAPEVSNEVWNFASFSAIQAQNSGAALGFVMGSLRSIHGFYGLRVRQNMAQAATTWTATRSRSQLKCIEAFQLFGTSGTSGDNCVYRFNGTDLVTSNATYAALAGPGGTAGTSYNTFPNRPIDVCDAMAPAIYWDGAQIKAFSFQYTGTLSWFSGLITAAANYGSDPTTSLAFVDGDLRAGTLNGVLGNQTLSNLKNSIYPGWSTVAASYDSQRAGGGLSVLAVYAYEGGLEAMPIEIASDVTALAASLAAMGDASSAADALNIQTLLTAYKNNGLFQASTTTLFTDFAAAFGSREVLPAWYGFDGPTIWALWPGSISGTPYQSNPAISAYNH